MTNLYIDGTPADPATLVYPSMSLSSSRANMCRHSFELHIAKADLIERLDVSYTQWVLSSKKEDAKRGYVDEDDEVGKAGYPSLPKILESQHLSEDLLNCYLLEDVFETFCCSNHSQIEFWLDQTSPILLFGDKIVFEGIAYSRKHP
tara:strand:+ start:674 stop:1114 length:441 start_codon:yes stop_codon:yes gene_type:complete